VEFDQSMEIGSTLPEHVEIYPTRSSFERQKAGGLAEVKKRFGVGGGKSGYHAILAEITGAWGYVGHNRA
jgi:hypothetical protein